MNAIEQFRAGMRKLGYTDQHINGEIRYAVSNERMDRKRQLVCDVLLEAVHAMTDEELAALEGGEL